LDQNRSKVPMPTLHKGQKQAVWRNLSLQVPPFFDCRSKNSISALHWIPTMLAQEKKFVQLTAKVWTNLFTFLLPFCL
jgi:hypothetical protein